MRRVAQQIARLTVIVVLGNTTPRRIDAGIIRTVTETSLAWLIYSRGRITVENVRVVKRNTFHVTGGTCCATAGVRFAKCS